MQKARESNIELLRIIAIILIITFHYVYRCTYSFAGFNINFFVTKSMYLFGELGVNLFILITGYFMCKNKFSIKKLILLILEVEFYNILINCYMLHKGWLAFTGKKSIFLSLFPIFLSQYWFITVYILLYLFSPFFNILINNMSRKKYQKFLGISILIWCLIPTLFGAFYNDSESMLYYSRFIWAIIIYFTGAYIRIYSPKLLNSKKKDIIIAFVSFLLMALFIPLVYKFNWLFSKIGIMEPAYFWHPNNILMFLLSVSIFSLFLKLKIKSNKIINRIASTTLGIYLLHDGKLAYYIWNNVFKTFNYIATKYFLIHIICTVLIIFLVGVVIDLIRQFMEKYTIKKFLNSKIFDKFINKCNKILTKLSSNL